MIIPARNIFFVCLALLLLALTAEWQAALMPVLWVGIGVVIFVCVLDAIRVYRLPAVTVLPALPNLINIGQETPCHWQLTCERETSLLLRPHFPSNTALSPQEKKLALTPGKVVQSTFALTPFERGDIDLTKVQYRQRSPWGLWWRNIVSESEAVVKVIPDLSAIQELDGLQGSRYLEQIGLLKQRKRGDGTDFHQLREYREGDSPRQIDWAATSRMQRLVTREYQQERDQQIIFMLDTGHRMRSKDESLSHFDYALNAILLLAIVSLKQGDSVGLLTLSKQQRWLPPGKGGQHLQHLLNQTYDLQPNTEAPDFLAASEQLLLRHNKRALVIILSSFRAEDNKDLSRAIHTLQRKHLVLLVSLKEVALEQAMKQTIRDHSDAERLGGVAAYIDEREQQLKALQALCPLAIDINPIALNATLLNQYFAIKSGGRL